MNRKERLELELERDALNITIGEMSKGDACMEVSRMKLVNMIKDLVRKIEEKLNNGE